MLRFNGLEARHEVPSSFLARLLILALVCLGVRCSSSAEPGESSYLVGAGMADITGPIVDVPFTGYSQPIGSDFDGPPASAAFGDVSTQPGTSYAPGETLSVSLWTGHPTTCPPGLRPISRFNATPTVIGSRWPRRQTGRPTPDGLKRAA